MTSNIEDARDKLKAELLKAKIMGRDYPYNDMRNQLIAWSRFWGGSGRVAEIRQAAMPWTKTNRIGY